MVAVLLSVMVVVASSWPLAALDSLKQAWTTELLWTAWEWTTPLYNLGCAVYEVTVLVSLCTTLRDIAADLLQGRSRSNAPKMTYCMLNA